MKKKIEKEAHSEMVGVGQQRESLWEVERKIEIFDVKMRGVSLKGKDEITHHTNKRKKTVECVWKAMFPRPKAHPGPANTPTLTHSLTHCTGCKKEKQRYHACFLMEPFFD